MDLETCRYFLAILDEGTMSKAAEVLHISQPSLSRQIAHLEEELGVDLFERKSKKLILTREGLLFSRRARELLSIESRTRMELNSLSQNLQGQLVIGTGEFKSVDHLLKLIHGFIDQYPDVSVSFITGTGDQITDWLKDGQVDLGFFLEPVNLSEFDTLFFPDHESWAAIVPKDHPLALKQSLRKEDLVSYPLIFPLRKEPENMLMEWFGKNTELNIRARSALSSNGALMCLDGFGVLISLQGLPAYANQRLIQIPLNPPVNSPVTLAWKRTFPKAPVLDAFLQYINENLNINSQNA